MISRLLGFGSVLDLLRNRTWFYRRILALRDTMVGVCPPTRFTPMKMISASHSADSLILQFGTLHKFSYWKFKRLNYACLPAWDWFYRYGVFDLQALLLKWTSTPSRKLIGTVSVKEYSCNGNDVVLNHLSAAPFLVSVEEKKPPCVYRNHRCYRCIFLPIQQLGDYSKLKLFQGLLYP